MSTRFTAVEAKRLKLKARIGLTGVTNGGKTYTALIIAKGLLQAEGFVNEKGDVDWSKVAVIDTERKRSLFYANNGEFGAFQFIEFDPPYDPNDYVDAVHYAESLGVEVIIIDSLSHAWNGSGGLLEKVNDLTKNSKTKNTFTDGWGGSQGGSAMQNHMIDEILNSKCHIIATFRQKMEYSISKDEVSGRTKIEKIGTKPIQKDDLEYEFDITLKLDNDHKAEIIKNTVKFFDEKGSVLEPITPDFGYQLGKYLSQGSSVDEILQVQLNAKKQTILNLVTQKPELKDIYNAYTNLPLKDITDIKLLDKIIKDLK